jgi:hypothetical protein
VQSDDAAERPIVQVSVGVSSALGPWRTDVAPPAVSRFAHAEEDHERASSTAPWIENVHSSSGVRGVAAADRSGKPRS